MNINDYEALRADPDVRERVRSKTFYAIGKSLDPRFHARWLDVPEDEKGRCEEIGFEAILALVDDYTTPGCECDYCTWNETSGQSRLIMCRQRWDRLSPEQRNEISESCAD